MRTATFSALFLLGIGPALAGYDSTWYRSQHGWPGEYPTGFSVVAADVQLPARAKPDPAAPQDITCGLPQKAVFHPWNANRKADYVVYQKIVALKATQNFVLGQDDNNVNVRKGETIEYVEPGAEGVFTARFKGKLYEGDQSVFDNIDMPDESVFEQLDLWLGVTCASGAKGWLLIEDLKDGKSRSGWVRGLGSWEPGRVDDGKVRDLTDAEVRKLAK